MFYVVGLGNPGEKYQNTRHNVGFMLAESFLQTSGLPSLTDSSKYVGQVSEGHWAGSDITVLLPNTYMNKSGSAVAKLVPTEEIGHLIVIYDDVDLPIGDLKVSVGRGSGGHNGIESIVASLKSKDFIRVRVGVSPKSFWTGQLKRPASAKLGDYVLGRFTAKEQKAIDELKPKVVEVIETILKNGPEAAMNRFN